MKKPKYQYSAREEAVIRNDPYVYHDYTRGILKHKGSVWQQKFLKPEIYTKEDKIINKWFGKYIGKNYQRKLFRSHMYDSLKLFNCIITNLLLVYPRNSLIIPNMNDRDYFRSKNSNHSYTTCFSLRNYLTRHGVIEIRNEYIFKHLKRSYQFTEYGYNIFTGKERI